MFKRSVIAMALGLALLAANAAPTITSFNPSLGSAGDLITIYGTGFSAGYVTVEFYSKKTSNYAGALSDTVIQAEVPTGVQTGPIKVFVGTSSFTSLGNFTVVGPGPYLTGFSPGFGAAGDLVILEGIHLDTAAGVTFNGVNAPDFVPNANGTFMNVYVPPGATNGPIVVLSAYGNSTSAVPFVVVGPGPYVSGFDPVNGNAGTTVYVSGIHLSTVTNVTFNGKSGVNLYPQSDTQIIVEAPSEVTSGPIKVSSPQGTFTTSSNFFGPPVITGFAPYLGRAGTNVVITGTNFLGATAVLFGDLTANFVVLSNNAVRAAVPAGTFSSPVRVNAPGSSFITTTNMRMQPTITGFTPGFGAPSTVVVISGAALKEGTSAVKFGGLNASSFTVIGYGQVNATVPTGATNAAISIATSNGTFTTSSMFYVPPVITGFSSSNSPAGSLITIYGQNLLGTTAVSFNGTTATFIPPTENTHLEVTVPLGFTTGPVTVTTPGGSTASPGKYYGAPSLTGFTPASGLPGTTVTLNGNNLEGTSQVRFNDLPAATFSVINNTSLQATVPANATTGFITVYAPGGTATSATLFVLNYTADLILNALTSSTDAVIGSNFVYYLNLFNDGPHDAPNVRLTNTLPQNVVLKSYTSPGETPSVSGNTLIFPLGFMISGASASVTITVEPTATGYLTNTARVFSNTTDPASSNNFATTRTFVEPLAILGVQRLGGNQVRVSWPLALANHHLQQRTNLSPTGTWFDIPATPVVISNQNTVTEPIIAPSRFYRLRK